MGGISVYDGYVRRFEIPMGDSFSMGNSQGPHNTANHFCSSEFAYGESERDYPWRALDRVFEQGETAADPLTIAIEVRASPLMT